MRRMELIKVRTVGVQEKLMVSEFLDTVICDLDEPNLVDASIFFQEAIPGDLCIIFFWSVAGSGFDENEQRLLLVQELSRFGMVDHSVWFEREGTKNNV